MKKVLLGTARNVDLPPRMAQADEPFTKEEVDRVYDLMRADLRSEGHRDIESARD